jgi:FkbM family methyltransferase
MTTIEPIRAAAEAHFVDDEARKLHTSDEEIADFLALLASKKPQDDNAERCYRWALDLDPNQAQALNGLGRIHLERREYDAARVCFRRAAIADPNPVFLVNGANAVTKLGDFAHALHLCNLAIDTDPEFLPAFIQKTAIQQLMGLDHEMLETIEAGLAIDPKCWELLFARYEVELAHGDIDNALRDYEHRPSRLELAEKLDELPEWQGENIDGKTILVCLEQGIGDQIQFARYLLAAKLGLAHVVLWTRPELARLFDPLVDQVITSNAEADPIHFDCWIGIGSLALHCRTDWDVPASGYLQADAESLDYFRRLMPADGSLRVGLCWAGNPEHAKDAERSLHFAQLAPLLDVPGVTFFSLQHGAAAVQNDGATTTKPKDLAFRTHDVLDAAGAIANLDLIITIDSAMLHLAGALNKPVWGLMRAAGDPRWGNAGIHTPLYPSATVWRQQDPGDWLGVIDRVKQALIDAAAAHVPDPPRETPAPPALLNTVICRYGRMAFHPNDHYIGRALRYYGEYSESEAKLLRAVLNPGDTVIEAGANIGGLTLALADIVGPGGEIIAFEPQHAYFQLLEWNAGERSNVIVRNEALGDDFDIIELAGIELDAVHAPGWQSTGAVRLVDQVPIDSFQVDPALIKIDVDGQEFEILQGAQATIERVRPILYVENDKPECYPNLVPWIAARGYRMYQHFAPLYNPRNYAQYHVNVFGKIVSAMLLCIPNERFMPDDFVRRFNLQRVRLRKEH